MNFFIARIRYKKLLCTSLDTGLTIKPLVCIFLQTIVSVLKTSAPMPNLISSVSRTRKLITTLD